MSETSEVAPPLSRPSMTFDLPATGSRAPSQMVGCTAVIQREIGSGPVSWVDNEKKYYDRQKEL